MPISSKPNAKGTGLMVAKPLRSDMRAIPSNYSPHDAERFVCEQHENTRSEYARDRARVLHSSAWRRLAAKTQVLSPTAGIDFARNRLTHSLEVAQIGRELAVALGLDQEIVDTACLAHDLGHPPFGHNGERALNAWASDHGGFEGNAQTLRILTRIEPKRFAPDGRSVGLNLTRAALDASSKYPWSLLDAAEHAQPRPAAHATARNDVLHRPTDADTQLAHAGAKFGYFLDDREIFAWMRAGAPQGRTCAEAQVMDLSDDIAYSVHDFEDAVVGEFIDPELLTAKHGHDVLLRTVANWSHGTFTEDELGAAFERITASKSWLTVWRGTRADQARLKNFTSEMIGRFAGAAILATLEAADGRPLARYEADVVVPRGVRTEIAVLKGIVAAFVMQHGGRQPIYRKQREVLLELADALWEAADHRLDPAFAADFRAASDETSARRAVIDQIASLSDQSAIAWHRKLCVRRPA